MKKEKPKTSRRADPSGLVSATYVNHAHVAWADGVIRLTLSEEGHEQPPIVRTAVVLSASTASGLIRVLKQALDTMYPTEASGVSYVAPTEDAPPASVTSRASYVMDTVDDAEIIHLTGEKPTIKA